MKEKRKIIRYPVIDGVVVAVRPYTEIHGYMIDLSLSGLSFRYIDSSPIQKPSSELTILVSSAQLHLDHIPYRTVADFSLPAEFAFSSIRTRRRCVEFGRLDAQQLIAVEKLILTCSIPPSRLTVTRPATSMGPASLQSL